MATIGRPPYYKTPEALQAKIDKYFVHCKRNEEYPNVLGLVVFLGFADRKSLKEQSRRSPQFDYVIQSARARIYAEKMQAAIKGEINTTIFIFDAVNNHGMVNTRSENKNDNKNDTRISTDVDDNDLEKQIQELIEKIEA